MRHIEIFREPGRYAGWPANYGIWSWGDEIVVGFTLGYMKVDEEFHARDRSRPFVTMQARSIDGGESWNVQPFPGRAPGNRGLSADEHMEAGMGVGDVLDGENAPVDPPGDINFLHPDFALMCARTGLDAGVTSFFYVTYDRCRTWAGPYRLPMFGQTGIAARTDYLVLDAQTCLLFLTANKTNGEEGRVFCARLSGESIQFVSWIGDELPGDDFAIMPASVRLDDRRILVTIRFRAGDSSGIDLYRSDDVGANWNYVGRPVEFSAVGHHSNPPTLTMLHDGRLCMTYGNRDQPYSMCARLSADGGVTWSGEIVLRSGAGNHDLGYPRTILRPDGTLVTAYYWNDSPDGERYIAATLWKPDS
jgi:hypothetical protein